MYRVNSRAPLKQKTKPEKTPSKSFKDLTKEDTQMVNKQTKNTQNRISFKTPLLEWLISKTQTTPNAGKDVGQQELTLTVWECKNSTATLEDSLVASQTTECSYHTIQQLLLGIYPNKLKTYVHTKPSKCFIDNS